MSYFLFNGVNSQTLGLLVSRPVMRPSWAREVSEISAPGRTRKIMQQSKTYANASLTINTVITDTDKLPDIYAALSGYGPLQLSSRPEEYLNVYISPLVPEAVALMTGELPISCVCEPFANAVEPTVVTLSSGLNIINNAGTVFSAPEIRFTATGEQVTVRVNGLDFIVGLTITDQGKEIIIDCENEVAYYINDSQQMISVNAQTYNDYPLLHTGENGVEIVGTVSAASINVKERWY